MEISKSLQTLDFFSTLESRVSVCVCQPDIVQSHHCPQDTFSFERLIALFQKKFWRHVRAGEGE